MRIRIFPPGPARGKFCPKCRNRSAVRNDGLEHPVLAEEGAVLTERTYLCRTPGCDGKIRTREISDGLVSKATLRSGS